MNATYIVPSHGELSLSKRIARRLTLEHFGNSPSLLAEAVALTLADRLVAVVETASPVPATDWIERFCLDYSPNRQIVSMLMSAFVLSRNDLISVHICRAAAVAFESAELSALRALEEYTSAANRIGSAVDEVESAIDAFLVRLDDADEQSAEHSRSVSLWCRRLARKLALDDVACSFAARCGLLHDVGKTMTPREILLAPRALTAQEWLVMRAHTTDGANLLRESELLRPYVPAVRSHHERLDGAGYPDGLTAEKIPVAVRIVSVADSFNAMIARRPYRLPLSPSVALEELWKHRGTQFDPSIVQAMIDVVDRHE